MPKIRKSGPVHLRTTVAGVPRITSRPVAAPSSPPREAEKAPAVTPSHTPQRPALSDRKDDWVAYAEAIGLDVDGLTKAEVVEAVEDAEG